MAQTADQTLEAPQATTPAAAEPTQNQSIAVEIYDQIYHLRGTDPAYIERLASIVDAKMRAVSAHGNTVDSLRVAVLAALNIADELCCARDRSDNLAGTLQNSQQSVRSRAGDLSHLLDELLEDRKVG
ncbi:cell division protein ZapA [Tunturiibacter gelidoferens]|jgi:cell division protein ZapA|uniref:Cell division protein ZapA n=1 Tax=Tunturiibacter gelidiferens TaxID=3069689 RepID=A0A9X0U3W9_9BACT|nr:cell division protein ZapA [Edaphobacter lichenicola]MBB5328851.1 cell division protein ZapA [Edaphobacter lichenicola]